MERTPVWFMRQAGRSLPEYRNLRERHTFWEIAGNAELCAEVTLQPVRRHGVDAAVMFADIMTPVLALGVGVELVEGVGPVIDAPIRTAADVARLRLPESPDDAYAALLGAIRIVRGELATEQAVVGFCGGPFTVAGYLVEGRPSREFSNVKALMYSKPDVWHALMEKLSDFFAAYVVAQVDAGADLIQLFDSWVGVLLPADYAEFVAPWSSRVLAAPAAPTIHFGTGTTTLLPAMAAAGGDVIGLDWRVPLDEGWSAVGAGPRRAGQPRPGGAARAVGADRAGGPRRASSRRRSSRSHLQSRPRRAAGHRPDRAQPSRCTCAGLSPSTLASRSESHAATKATPPGPWKYDWLRPRTSATAATPTTAAGV